MGQSTPFTTREPESPNYLVGQDEDGHWIVRDARGLIGGSSSARRPRSASLASRPIMALTPFCWFPSTSGSVCPVPCRGFDPSGGDETPRRTIITQGAGATDPHRTARYARGGFHQPPRCYGVATSADCKLTKDQAE